MTSPDDDPQIHLQELQDTVSRLSSHKGVESVLILNRNGDVLVESLKPKLQSFAKQTHKLLEMATTYIQSLEPEDEVSFLQLRSKDHRELMVAPHEGYVLAVLKKSH